VHKKFPVSNILQTLAYIYSDMYEIGANTFFEEKFMCAPSFPVCAHLTTCGRAHTCTA